MDDLPGEALASEPRDFPALLRHLRQRAAWTQATLAAQAGISAETIYSFEGGRRHPMRPTVFRLAEALGLDTVEVGKLLTAAGFELDGDPVMTSLAARRDTWQGMHAELLTYPWPMMVMNDNYEIMDWNAAANDVAELDLGRDLAKPGARQLLRMALLPHFQARLINWNEVLGVLIRMYRFDTMELANADESTQYFATLANDIARDHPRRFPALLDLWSNARPWPHYNRITFPVEWRAGDGTPLRFDATVTPWGVFDSAGALDWFPADATTCRWLDDRRRAREAVPATLPADESAEQGSASPLARGEATWNQLLRTARESAGLDRRALVSLAKGISESALYSYEAGRRRPSRAALMKIVRALEMDSVTMNIIFAGLGHDPEPSDWARFITGRTPRANRVKYQHQGESRNWAEMQAEIEKHAWPCLIVSGRCEVMCANDAAEQLAGVSFRSLPAAGVERNLLTLVTSQPFRERITNWTSVATELLPGTLAQHVNGSSEGPNASYFRHVVENVRQTDPAVLADLVRLWRSGTTSPARVRILVPVHWRTEEQIELNFNVLISPWNAVDPAWAVDWHPADAATWEWLGR